MVTITCWGVPWGQGSLEGEISELEDHKQQLLDEAEAEKVPPT